MELQRDKQAYLWSKEPQKDMVYLPKVLAICRNHFCDVERIKAGYSG